MKAGFLFITMLLIAVPPAYAQTRNPGNVQDEEEREQTQRQQKPEQKQEEQKQYLYQWTDGKGGVHITDDLAKVPKQYRPSARKLESAPGDEGEEKQSGRRTLIPPTNYSDEAEREADRKEDWQQRMKAAKRRLADAEKRYRELEKKRDELIMGWGGPSSGHLEGREEAGRIEEQMKQIQKEIDDARNEIEVKIPEEARKAGAPPGWLRE